MFRVLQSCYKVLQGATGRKAKSGKREAETPLSPLMTRPAVPRPVNIGDFGCSTRPTSRPKPSPPSQAGYSRSGQGLGGGLLRDARGRGAMAAKERRERKGVPERGQTGPGVPRLATMMLMGSGGEALGRRIGRH